MSDTQFDINNEQGTEKSSISDPRLYITPLTDKGYSVMNAMRSLADKFKIAKSKINALPFIEKEFVEQGENPLLGTVRLEDLQDVIFEVFGLSLVINTEGFDLDKSINGVAATVYVLTESDGYQPVATMQRTLAQLSSSYVRVVDPYLLLASESQAIVRAAAQVGLCRTKMTPAGQQAALEEVKAQAKLAEKEKAEKEKAPVKAKPQAKEKAPVKATPQAKEKTTELPSNKDKVSSSKLSASDKNDTYPAVAEMRDMVTHFLTEEGLTQKAFIKAYLGEDIAERRVNKLGIADLKKLFNQLPDKDKR
jgi:hypothetical protein